MENQNDELQQMQNVCFAIIYIFGLSFVLNTLGIKLAPSVLHYFPKISEWAKDQEQALWLAGIFTIIPTGILLEIVKSIINAVFTKPIPNDNILDAPDEL